MKQLFAIGFAIFFLKVLLSGVTAVAHETTSPKSIIIEMYEKGYSTSSVSIEKGTAIIFHNRSNSNFWPASDSHPTHKDYDGTTLDAHCTTDVSSTSFDACKPILPDERWTFTFTKPGTFAFHDHLWPHFTGHITVTDPSNSADEELSRFQRIFHWIKSFFQTIRLRFFLNKSLNVTTPTLSEETIASYLTLLDTHDPRYVIQLLQKESETNAELLSTCHESLHAIGKASYKKYASFHSAASFQQSFCNSGYIHGVFEAYFASSSDPIKDLGDQCDVFAKTHGTQLDYWQCLHGAGHGFMYHTGGDVDTSLAMCATSFKTHAEWCQNGVYMELFNAEELAKEASFIDGNSPEKVCEQRTMAQNDCFTYLPVYYSKQPGITTKALFDQCHTLSTQGILPCIHGIGTESMKRHMHEPDAVFALCQITNTLPEQEACMIGAISMYMVQNASLESGEILCRNSSSISKHACKKAIENMRPYFTKI